MKTTDTEIDNAFERRIAHLAAALPYPPTPRVIIRPATRSGHPTRKLALARAVLGALVVLSLAGLTIPELRAALLTLFRLGAVTVTLDDAQIALGGLPDDAAPPRLDTLTGAMTLAEAAAAVDYPLRLPPGPSPDRAFVQEGEVVVLVWLGEGRIAQALYHIPEDSWAVVKQASALTHTTVAGQPAYWVDSPHPVTFLRDGVVMRTMSYFVRGRVLIWQDQGGVTFRLETGSSLEAARALAEAIMAGDE